MKLLAALLVCGSLNAYAYTPDYDISVTSKSTVTLEISNDLGSDIVCSYRMSWFENALSFKRFIGKITIAAGDVNNVTITKDIAAHVTFLKAKVDCK